MRDDNTCDHLFNLIDSPVESQQSTSTSSAASRASASLPATTSATGSPTWRTQSRASEGRCGDTMPGLPGTGTGTDTEPGSVVAIPFAASRPKSSRVTRGGRAGNPTPGIVVTMAFTVSGATALSSTRRGQQLSG